MGAQSGNGVLRQASLSPAPLAYALFSQDLQMSGNTEGGKKPKLALLQE